MGLEAQPQSVKVPHHESRASVLLQEPPHSVAPYCLPQQYPAPATFENPSIFPPPLKGDILWAHLPRKPWEMLLLGKLNALLSVEYGSLSWQAFFLLGSSPPPHMVLEFEPRTLDMICQHFTTELHSQLWHTVFEMLLPWTEHPERKLPFVPLWQII